MAKFANFGRVAKLLITFEPASVSSLRLMQGQESEMFLNGTEIIDPEIIMQAAEEGAKGL